MQNLNNDFQWLFAIVVKLISKRRTNKSKGLPMNCSSWPNQQCMRNKRMWQLPKEIWWNNVRETRNTNKLKTKLNELNLNVLISLQTQCLRLFVNEAFIVIDYRLHNIVALFCHRSSNVQCFGWLGWCNNTHCHSWVQNGGSTKYHTTTVIMDGSD